MILVGLRKSLLFHCRFCLLSQLQFEALLRTVRVAGYQYLIHVDPRDWSIVSDTTHSPYTHRRYNTATAFRRHAFAILTDS